MMVEFVENNIMFLFAAGIGILLLGQFNVFIFSSNLIWDFWISNYPPNRRNQIDRLFYLKLGWPVSLKFVFENIPEYKTLYF